MQHTSYISTPVPKKVTLAEESWQVFSPFLSRYQWAFDDPSHSPRKEEIAHAIRNKGTKGACTFFRPQGYKYILPVLHARHFEQAVSKQRKVYYVSWGKSVLLYFDVDLHQSWQTRAEGEEAKRLLHDLLARIMGQPTLFWADSSRGFNGYLKVNLLGSAYAQANDLFGRLEKALQRYLAFHTNLADFEIKGRVGHLQGKDYAWSQYGKLPLHAPDWTFARLDEFKKTPTVPLSRLKALCEKLEEAIPAEVLTRHKVYKHSLGDAPVVQDGYFLVTPADENALVEKHGEGWRYLFAILRECEDGIWLGLKYHRPGQCPATEVEVRAMLAAGPSNTRCPVPIEKELAPRTVSTAAPKAPQKVNLKLVDLRAEPDSFERQRNALLQLARYLKRVPSVDEALQLIKEQRLYTGTWEDNRDRREARVRSTLNFIALTFDPAKCRASGRVNVGKYDAWTEKRFPHGLTGKGHRRLSEHGVVIDGSSVQVSAPFIAAFMAVVEFGLLVDQNEDGSLPHNRAQQLWDSLHDQGLIRVKFCPRKWAVCRDELERQGIITIVDRNYSPGTAMKWAPGVYFPFLGLWKTKRQPSLLGPDKLTDGRELGEQGHNTLLCMQPAFRGVRGCWVLPRPPPMSIHNPIH